MFTAAHHEGHCAQIDSTQSQECNLVNTITLSNTQSALILEHLRLELFVTQVYDIKNSANEGRISGGITLCS